MTIHIQILFRQSVSLIFFFVVKQDSLSFLLCFHLLLLYFEILPVKLLICNVFLLPSLFWSRSVTTTDLIKRISASLTLHLLFYNTAPNFWLVWQNTPFYFLTVHLYLSIKSCKMLIRLRNWYWYWIIISE